MNKAIINTKKVKINKNDPSKYLLSLIKESKNNRKEGSYHSFKNNKKAIKFLDK